MIDVARQAALTTAAILAAGPAAAATCAASWYGAELRGRTASGQPWRPNGISVAHRSLPFGTLLEILSMREARTWGSGGMSYGTPCLAEAPRQFPADAREGNALSDGNNPQQALADAVVRAAKDRRQLVELAERATIAPESLTFNEISRIAVFVLSHQNCWQASRPS